ncbi:MAG: glycosyl hydrolase family 18 protein [Chitinophagaceae bacterium]
MKRITVSLLILFVTGMLRAQPSSFAITAYYAGPAEWLDSFSLEKVTHLIYSFGHLQGNRLHISNATDTARLRKMVALKSKYPGLRIILSLGGWGGCSTCSPVFATARGRKEFARSVRTLTKYFHTDGIDLDWEYPGIAGYPGHPYAAADKQHFTRLIYALRKTLGKQYEISFAAGGFDQFIDSSVQWRKVMRRADKVYIMSYDLVHGYSTVTGHHTPLYSTPQQELSADHAVNRLLQSGIAPGKIVIGAAFYARMFLTTDTLHAGLYRPGSFYHGISYSRLADTLTAANGFMLYRDTLAQAPYAFHPGRKVFVTWDDSLSVAAKTDYAVRHHLGGIMFWQLAEDKFRNGLLDAIRQSSRKP